jgi:hypothetical protein
MLCINIDKIANIVFGVWRVVLIGVFLIIFLCPCDLVLEIFLNLLLLCENLIGSFNIWISPTFVGSGWLSARVWIVAKISKKWADSGSRVVLIILGKFRFRKEINPVILSLVNIVPQVHLNKLVDDFRLTISL